MPRVQVPPEIVEEIVNRLADTPEPAFYEAFQRCLLVSRAFYAATRRRLFSALSIRVGRTACKRLKLLLQYRHADDHLPPLYTLVRSLAINDFEHQEPEPTTQKLYFDSPDLLDILKLFTVMTSPPSNVLEKLHIAVNTQGYLGGQSPTKWEKFPPSIQQTFLDICDLPSIRTIILDAITPPESFIIRIVSSSSCRNLSLASCGGPDTNSNDRNALPIPSRFNLDSLSLRDPYTATRLHAGMTNWVRSHVWADFTQLKALHFRGTSPSADDLATWLRLATGLQELSLYRLSRSYFDSRGLTILSLAPSLTKLSLFQFGPTRIRVDSPSSPSSLLNSSFNHGAVETIANANWLHLDVLPTNPPLAHLAIRSRLGVAAFFRPTDPLSSQLEPKYPVFHDNKGCCYWEAMSYALDRCRALDVSLSFDVHHCIVDTSGDQLPPALFAGRMKTQIERTIQNLIRECNRRRAGLHLNPITVVFHVYVKQRRR